MTLTTIFETEHGSQNLQTLCKHFGRKIPVQFTANAGVIQLPFGKCELVAGPTGLDLTVSADTEADLDRAAQVIASHLERYAFRENPELIWQQPAA